MKALIRKYLDIKNDTLVFLENGDGNEADDENIIAASKNKGKGKGKGRDNGKDKSKATTKQPKVKLSNKEAWHFIVHAWNEVTATSIRSCFRRFSTRPRRNCCQPVMRWTEMLEKLSVRRNLSSPNRPRPIQTLHLWISVLSMK